MDKLPSLASRGSVPQVNEAVIHSGAQQISGSNSPAIRVGNAKKLKPLEGIPSALLRDTAQSHQVSTNNRFKGPTVAIDVKSPQKLVESTVKSGLSLYSPTMSPSGTKKIDFVEKAQAEYASRNQLNLNAVKFAKISVNSPQKSRDSPLKKREIISNKQY